ncbi:HypC/HybG/HupF family hydrogenase formation chaperone [bacterium]|nr:HypC/HybG/HupF family hydrogenase formation chaperone [bacterium]
MCLAVFGRVMVVEGTDVSASATVDMGGSLRRVSLAMLDGVEPGMWVTVHSGYALSILPEEEALSLAAITDELEAG